MGEELCNVGKVVRDLFVYSRKVGRQQIGSLSQEDRDLLTLRTKCTFDALSDICIHHEEKYIGSYQAAQRYCVNPFNTHGTAKENMKAAKNDCENNKDDQDSSYLSKDFDRSRFNSSAEGLGFSLIKPVDKRMQ